MPPRRRCLIVERHKWETGSNQRQLQFVLDTARSFFGRGNIDRQVQVRVFMPADAPQPAFQKTITISHIYRRSSTRRINRFPQMGSIPPSFIFFQENEQPAVYDLWWQEDVAIVAARYANWRQGRNSQHGRGRLSLIVDGPVPRVIDTL